MTKPATMQVSSDPFERERACLDAFEAFTGRGEPAPEGYTRNAKGHLIPDHLIPESAGLEETTVRTIAAYALDLHRQIHRFVGHTYDDLAAMDDLVAERYGLKRRGGAKGNRTYRNFDGTIRVVVQVQDRVEFGPELAVARDLVEECIAEWGEGARDEIRLLASQAFDADKQGQVSREKVFALRRLEIDDERWRQAQRAITDAIRVIGSASYVRFYVRPTPDTRWSAISIDTNGAQLPAELR